MYPLALFCRPGAHTRRRYLHASRERVLLATSVNQSMPGDKSFMLSSEKTDSYFSSAGVECHLEYAVLQKAKCSLGIKTSI